MLHQIVQRSFYKKVLYKNVISVFVQLCVYEVWIQATSICHRSHGNYLLALVILHHCTLHMPMLHSTRQPSTWHHNPVRLTPHRKWVQPMHPNMKHCRLWNRILALLPLQVFILLIQNKPQCTASLCTQIWNITACGTGYSLCKPYCKTLQFFFCSYKTKLGTKWIPDVAPNTTDLWSGFIEALWKMHNL